VTIIVEAENAQIAESIAFKEGILISKVEQCYKESSRRFPLWAIIIGIIVCLALVGNVIVLISTKLNSVESAQGNQQIISEFKEQTELQRKQLESANNEIALLKETVLLNKAKSVQRTQQMISEFNEQTELQHKQLENASNEIALLRGTISLDKADIPKVRSNNIKPEKQWTPEKILSAYFEAPTWQDRLPLVLDPDAAYKIMAQNYDRMFAHYEPPKYYFIHPCKIENWTIGQKICVEVDIEEDPFVPYDLIDTNDGWRIDWAASRVKWDKDSEQRIKRKYGGNYDFEVKILKKYQVGDRYTSFDLAVTNKSNVNLSYWEISGTAYDMNAKYLAKAMTNGQNLGPNATKTATISFCDVNVEDVNNVKISLEKALGVSEQGYSIPIIGKLFVLKQVK
jgi:hypothetical protein